MVVIGPEIVVNGDVYITTVFDSNITKVVASWSSGTLTWTTSNSTKSSNTIYGSTTFTVTLADGYMLDTVTSNLSTYSPVITSENTFTIQCPTIGTDDRTLTLTITSTSRKISSISSAQIRTVDTLYKNTLATFGSQAYYGDSGFGYYTDDVVISVTEGTVLSATPSGGNTVVRSYTDDTVTIYGYQSTYSSSGGILMVAIDYENLQDVYSIEDQDGNVMWADETNVIYPPYISDIYAEYDQEDDDRYIYVTVTNRNSQTATFYIVISSNTATTTGSYNHSIDANTTQTFTISTGSQGAGVNVSEGGSIRSQLYIGSLMSSTVTKTFVARS